MQKKQTQDEIYYTRPIQRELSEIEKRLCCWPYTNENITGEPYKIDRIHLPYDYIIVGSDSETAEKFDLQKIFRGLEKLADNFTE